MPTLSCATWNLRVGRKPDVVAREVDHLLTAHDLDVLLVCEAAGYIKALRRALKGRYKIATGLAGDISGRDSAIIVRKGLSRGIRRVHRLERMGWERRAGRPGLHHNRSAVSQSVEGIRFLSVHLPPPAGDGQPLRRAAMGSALKTVHDIGERWTERGRRWVMAGDWNLTPEQAIPRIVFPPKDFPHIGAHIEWAIGHGVRLSVHERIDPAGSDHPPVLFRVSPR